MLTCMKTGAKIGSAIGATVGGVAGGAFGIWTTSDLDPYSASYGFGFFICVGVGAGAMAGLAAGTFVGLTLDGLVMGVEVLKECYRGHHYQQEQPSQVRYANNPHILFANSPITPLLTQINDPTPTYGSYTPQNV